MKINRHIFWTLFLILATNLTPLQAAPKPGKYSSYGGWQELQGAAPGRETAAMDRLWSWNFNPIVAWSDSEMFSEGTPHTVILTIGAAAGAD